MTLATLLVSCPDRKGIVAALAQLLYGHGANILDSDQHTDTVAGMFFQRVKFDLATLTTDRIALEAALREVGERFGMDEQALTRCSHRDSVDDLVRKGRELEKRVLGNAVRLHLQDRVLVYRGKTVVFD